MIKRCICFPILITIFALFLFSCVKGYDPEPDPVFPIKDFIGQWKGSFPYSSSGPVSEIRVSLLTYNKNNSLTGYMNTPDGILILDGQQFFNGIFFFSIRKNNNCPDWDVTGSAYLITTTNMGLAFGGTFCEEHPRDIEGTMGRISPSPDTTVLMTLAAVGHRLTYDITDTTGSTVEMIREIEYDLGNGVWREKTTLPGKYNSAVSLNYLFSTPVDWGELPAHDSLYADRMINYSIDARPGTTYIHVTPDDSITTRILSLNTLVNVPAGTFKCIKMSKKYVALTPREADRYFEIWLSNNYGTIQTMQYQGDSVIMTQVLKEKSW